MVDASIASHAAWHQVMASLNVVFYLASERGFSYAVPILFIYRKPLWHYDSCAHLFDSVATASTALEKGYFKARQRSFITLRGIHL